MYIIENIRRIEPFHGRVGLSIGNFEGFHRGHVKIIKRLINECKKLKLFSAVITFKQHPLKVLSGYEPEKLCAAADKIWCFKKSGIDLLIYIDFSPEFSATSPLDFLIQLRKSLSPRILCLGSSFRFGKNNEGNLQLLLDTSEEFQYKLISVDEVLYIGKPVSSTRIRNAIKEGKIKLATDLLGRQYSVYLAAESGNTLMKTFISNVAVPLTGKYSGKIEGLTTKELCSESFKISNKSFSPVSKDKYVNNQIYQFYFDPIDAGEK